jgi:hypothetical protein
MVHEIHSRDYEKLQEGDTRLHTRVQTGLVKPQDD